MLYSPCSSTVGYGHKEGSTGQTQLHLKMLSTCVQYPILAQSSLIPMSPALEQRPGNEARLHSFVSESRFHFLVKLSYLKVFKPFMYVCLHYEGQFS